MPGLIRGTLGKILGGAAKVLEKTVGAAWKSATAPARAVVAVLNHQQLDDAVRAAGGDIVAGGATALEATAWLQSTINNVQVDIVKGVLGPGAADALSDVQRLSQPLGVESGGTVARGIEMF